LQPEKIKWIEKSLLLLKIRRIEKPFLLLKIRRIEKSLLLLKIRRIEKSLKFTENQADLRNPCVYRKTGGFEKSLRLQKKKADERIPAGVEIPAPGKKPEFEEKPVGLEKQAARLLFRLGGISSC
jgi:hypothetical protein